MVATEGAAPVPASGVAAAAALPCPNCGAPVPGAYCGSCGQRRGAARLETSAVLREVAAEVLQLEGSTAGTLLDLVVHPGRVASAYLAGHRARYPSPIRLYLVASTVFFGLFLVTRPIDQAYYHLPPASLSAYAEHFARGLLAATALVAVLLALLYPRRSRSLVEHGVSALLAGSAALAISVVLLAAATVLKLTWGTVDRSPSWLPDIVFLLYLPGALAGIGHLALSLRRTYGGGAIAAGARALFLAAVAAAAVFAVPLLM